MQDVHFLALDGGGTGCRAMICGADGRELGRAVGGGANLTSDFEAACENILATISNAYEDAGLQAGAMSSGMAVLGVAGAEIGDCANRLQDRLDFAKLRVLSDRDTAIAGVLGEEDGTLAQIGTGSFFVTCRAGVTRHAGGWGLVLGDECSGAWLGRELLRSTLRAQDGLEDGSGLTETVLSAFSNNPQAIILSAQTASPADFAAYAPQLFSACEGGDARGLTGSFTRQFSNSSRRLRFWRRDPVFHCIFVVVSANATPRSSARRFATGSTQGRQSQRGAVPWQWRFTGKSRISRPPHCHVSCHTVPVAWHCWASWPPSGHP